MNSNSRFSLHSCWRSCASRISWTYIRSEVYLLWIDVKIVLCKLLGTLIETMLSCLDLCLILHYLWNLCSSRCSLHFHDELWCLDQVIWLRNEWDMWIWIWLDEFCFYKFKICWFQWLPHTFLSLIHEPFLKKFYPMLIYFMRSLIWLSIRAFSSRIEEDIMTRVQRVKLINMC